VTDHSDTPPPGWEPTPPPPPAWPQPGWQQPTWQPPSYGTPGWSPGNWYGQPAQLDHPMTMPAFIVGILALLLTCFLPFVGLVGIVAIILGTIARRAMRAQPGHYRNEGLALAGLILGWIAAGLGALMALALLALFGSVFIFDAQLE
jgi:uncharacterized protein DUF4190